MRRFIVLGFVAAALGVGCSRPPEIRAGGSGGTGGPAELDAGGSGGGAGGSAAVDAGTSDARGGTAGGEVDDALFAPAGLPDTNEDGHDEGLVLVALTLVPGATGPSFYAAVQNDWSTPLCEAGMMIDFFDTSGQMVGTAAGVLQSSLFYQLDDGSGTVISCVAPGQIAMTGATGLPSSIVIGQLGSLEHLFPSFNVAVTPVGELTVSGVEAVTGAAGTTYTGTVGNQVGSTVSNPSVAIFPVNRSGRPLGMATASATMDLPTGGTWSFETSAVDDPGAGQMAYASGSVP